MFIAGFPAGPWGTNCYLVATGPGTECVVVDPGKDAAPAVEQVVRENGLKPVAVLLTHGHIDHMWSVTPVAGAYRGRVARPSASRWTRLSSARSLSAFSASGRQSAGVGTGKVGAVIEDMAA